MRQIVLPGALAVLALSCAGRQSARSAPSTSAAAPEMHLLARSAVPGVPSTTAALAIGELAKDAPIPGLASKIAAWGYRDGRQRTFQGPSRHLTLVVSRFLVFGDDTGAQSFAAFVDTNARTYFGVGVEVHQLVAQGRSGWMFIPPPCACHLANPAYIGVLVEGSDVVWLEINGPDATKAVLVRLLDPRRSVVAT